MCIIYVYIFRIIIFSFLLKFFSFSPTEIPYIYSRVLLYVFRFDFSFCVNNGLEKKKIIKKNNRSRKGQFLSCQHFIKSSKSLLLNHISIFEYVPQKYQCKFQKATELNTVQLLSSRLEKVAQIKTKYFWHYWLNFQIGRK